MLQERFTSVISVRDREELLKTLVGFTSSLGFDTVAATAVLDTETGAPEFYGVDNTPQAFRATFEDAEIGRRSSRATLQASQ